MLARVFDIQRCSIHDGPGIRTTVFLAGCPLRCAWCHNPEGLGSERGQAMSVEAILAEVLKDRDYYVTSGGGITLSGGEPLLHVGPVVALLEAAKAAGLHTCVQTSGAVPEAHLAAVLGLVDLFQFDLKHMDARRHLELTGAGNQRILGSAAFLVAAGATVQFRLPLVPGSNDDPDNLAAVARWLLEHCPPGARALRLVPYQGLYLAKYAALGLVPRLAHVEPPSAAELARVTDFMSARGITVAIDG